MISHSGFHSSKQASSPVDPQDGGAVMREAETMHSQESPVFEVHLGESQDDDNDSSEEDVHQCGRCKQVFHTLASYLDHKSKKVCKIPTKPRPKQPPSILDSISEVPDDALNDMPPNTTVSKENIFEVAAKNTIFKQLQVLVLDHEQNQERPPAMLPEAIRKMEVPTSNQNDIAPHRIAEKQPSPVAKLSPEDDKKGKPPLVMTINTKKVKEAAEAANLEGQKRGRGRRRKVPPIKPDDVMEVSELTPLKPPQRKRGRPAKGLVIAEKKPPVVELPNEQLPKNHMETREPPVPQFPVIPGVNSVPPLPTVPPMSTIPAMPTDTVPNVPPCTISMSALTSALQVPFGPPKDEVKPKGKRGRPAKKIPVYRCPICKLEFPHKEAMAEHKSKHSKMFKCKICHESFFTEEKLDKHMEKETHHYPCDACDKVCLSKASLQRHKTTHNEKSHVCDICNRAFKAARDMKSHKISRHSDERNFVCEICHKGFSRREKLKRHSLIHSPNRPAYQCPFRNHVGCDKVFYRKDKLTRHLYSHSKVKPFKCEHCDKSFARTDNLREHLRTHTGVFRYYCTVCGKGQPGPKKFIQHMQKQHNIETPEVPPPLEENAPEPLVQQHKAVVKAETAARAAKAAATAFKKERIKVPTPGHEGQQDQLHVHEDDPNNQVSLSLQHQQQAQIAITQNVSTIASVALPQFHGVATITSIPPLHTVPQPRPPPMPSDDATGMRDIRTPTGHSTPGPRTPGPHQHPHAQNEGVAVIHNDLQRHHNAEDVSAMQMEPTEDGVSVEQHQNRVAVQLLPHGVLHPTLPVSMTQQFTTLLNSDLAAIGEAVVRNPNLFGAVYRNFPPH